MKKISSIQLDTWRPTRDTIHQYSIILGKIKSSLSQSVPHSFHVGLQVSKKGLTTGAIAIHNNSLELLLDLINNNLTIIFSRDKKLFPLNNNSTQNIFNEVMTYLERKGVNPEVDHSLFTNKTINYYDRGKAGKYWQAISFVETVLANFKAKIGGKTGPITFWPHNFDLALLWFSGRLVPGFDPDDVENSEEQMGFGFSTGDEGIPNPYFYITAHPYPEGLTKTKLPDGASWNSDGWQGALMPFEFIVNSSNPYAVLLNFLTAVQLSGAALMK